MQTDEAFLQSVGRAVVVARTESNVSQEALAAMLGTSRAYLSSIELGKRNVSIGVINNLAKVLNYRASDLVAKAEELLDRKANLRQSV